MTLECANAVNLVKLSLLSRDMARENGTRVRREKAIEAETIEIRADLYHKHSSPASDSQIGRLQEVTLAHQTLLLLFWRLLSIKGPRRRVPDLGQA